MTFADATLLQLTDPATRAAVFDEASLAQILDAAYGGDAGLLTGPYSPVFDELQFGSPVPAVATIEAAWGPVTGERPQTGQFRLSGLGGKALIVDALWRGAIVARVQAANDAVTAVAVRWPPTEASATAHPADVSLTFAPPGAAQPAPRPLPVSAALLIRDKGFVVGELVALSKELRDRLMAHGAVQPAGSGPRLKRAVVPVWVVPLTTFDDAGWPGATPAVRRAAAGTWLAREGIGLVTTT
jgi:hypothetical protein